MEITKRLSLFSQLAALFMLMIGVMILDMAFSNRAISEGRETKMEWTIKSSVFAEGQEIPKKYTCEGEDISPPLTWSDPPEGTQEIVLIMDDPDAPVGVFTHWVIYNISPETKEAPEGVQTKGAMNKRGGGPKQGLNDFGKVGYGGPCPPRGPKHRYFFKLYALDAELNLEPRASKNDVEKAMKGHIIAQAQLTGTFRR